MYVTDSEHCTQFEASYSCPNCGSDSVVEQGRILARCSLANRHVVSRTQGPLGTTSRMGWSGWAGKLA